MRHRGFITIVYAAIAFVFALSASSAIAAELSPAAPPSQQKSAASLIAKPIEFTLPDLKDSRVSIKDLRGHPLIIDFWATWCPPCRRQIPELKTIYDRYKVQGLIVIGVACDAIEGDGVRDVRPFIKKFDINYPILIGTEAVIDKLDVEGMPTTMFLDREGKLVTTIVGGGRSGELSQAAKSLFAR